MLGRKAMEMMSPGTIGTDAYLQQLDQTLATGQRSSVELVGPHPDGEMRAHTVEFIAERDGCGNICGALALGREITQQVRVRRALTAKEREFRSLAENAGDNIVRWDTEGRMRYVNPAMARVLRLPVTTMLGLTAAELYPDGRSNAIHEAVLQVVRQGEPTLLELRLPEPGGRAEQVHQVRLVPERDETGVVCSVLGIGRDITDSIAQREAIESLARTDPLTQLANRQALHERAAGLFAAANRHRTQVGVMLLDVDQFKSINDGMGHSAGDALLCEIARRLSACTRANDLLVRLGGDEFVVLTPDIDNAAAMAVIAGKVHEALAQPLRLAQRDLHITASIGVALYPNDGEALEQLLAHADSAMYHAKRNGRARTEYYRRRTERSDPASPAAGGIDARGPAWRRPRALLPTAGRPAVGRLDWWAPRRCCAGATRLWACWPRHLHPAGRRDRHDRPHGALGDAAPRPRRSCAGTAAAPSPCAWRSTSRRGSSSTTTCPRPSARCWPAPDAIRAGWRWRSPRVRCWRTHRWCSGSLESLRTLGVRVAIDDFGTGYSALNYLARFRVDCLKIDKSFVDGIGQCPRRGELVKAFIAMAGALGLDLVAEGIETEEQARFLTEQGCRNGQGYRFGRPMPLAQFELEFLRAAVA